MPVISAPLWETSADYRGPVSQYTADLAAVDNVYTYYLQSLFNDVQITAKYVSVDNLGNNQKVVINFGNNISYTVTEYQRRTFPVPGGAQSFTISPGPSAAPTTVAIIMATWNNDSGDTDNSTSASVIIQSAQMIPVIYPGAGNYNISTGIYQNSGNLNTMVSKAPLVAGEIVAMPLGSVLGNGFNFYVENQNTGQFPLLLAPSGGDTINNVAGNIQIWPGTTALVVSDGKTPTNFHVYLFPTGGNVKVFTVATNYTVTDADDGFTLYFFAGGNLTQAVTRPGVTFKIVVPPAFSGGTFLTIKTNTTAPNYFPMIDGFQGSTYDVLLAFDGITKSITLQYLGTTIGIKQFVTLAGRWLFKDTAGAIALSAVGVFAMTNFPTRGNPPDIIRLALVCDIANLGYAVNDRIYMIINSASNAGHGATLYYDNAGQQFKISYSSIGIIVTPKAGGVGALITLADWHFELTLEYFNLS